MNQRTIAAFGGLLLATSAHPSSAQSLNSGEMNRIQNYLDSLYLPSDVKYSFHTKFGETIDCIDFFAQSGVKAMAAMGHPITQLPPPPDLSQVPDSLKDVAFLGQPDDEGHPRQCPNGSVPIVKITSAQLVAAGGLDSFLHNVPTKVPPVTRTQTQPTPPDSNAPLYQHILSIFQGASSFTDGYSQVSIWTPFVQRRGDHSLAQSWTQDATSTQSVEVGWTVDPVLNPDSNPHLFIYATKDQYATGCYNNIPNKPSTCVPFTLMNRAPLSPGMTLTSSTFGGATSELVLWTSYGNLYGGAGWNVHLVGYYPQTDWSGSFQTSGTQFYVGGEVYDQSGTWAVPMGSGASPIAGSGQSAYLWNSQANVAGSGWNTNFGTPTNSGGYGTNYFTFNVSGGFTYFGDNPNVFFGQNFGYESSPIGDWAPGSFKGECGQWKPVPPTVPPSPPSTTLGPGSIYGMPVIGLSHFTSSTAFHAVRCGQTSFNVTASSCNVRTIGSSDNRGTTDGGWDWDFGTVKGECATNEYVAGVAQSTTGQLSAILCCPTSVTHASCDAQIFYTSNSSAYSSPDWDPNVFKGNCPANQYVAGVSKRFYDSSAHGMLCCSP